MSEAPTATAPPHKPAKGSGKTYGGLTRNQWAIAGGVFAVALGIILWRRHQAAKAAAAAGTPNAGNGECTDGSGNIINCADSATASELSQLQDELDTLGAGGSGSGGGGSYWQGSDSGSPSQTSTGTNSGTTTGTGTTTAAGGPISVTPVNLHTTQVSKTSVGVAWTAPTIPSGQGPLTGYGVEVYNSDGTSEGPSWKVPPGQLYANAGGLKPGTRYGLNVWCDPAKTGGPHASVDFTTKS